MSLVFEPLPFAIEKGKYQQHFDISDYDRLIIPAINERFKVEERAVLMNFTYNDLKQLCSRAEHHMHQVVTDFLNHPLEDRECGMPLDLGAELSLLQIPYNEEKFRKHLRLKRVPYQYLLALAEQLQENYKIQEVQS